MFTDFFYLLRLRGLRVSLQEWQTLLRGLQLGLHRSSLTGFYRLARSVLVHTEADFDKFDQVFLEFFKGVSYEGELPPEGIRVPARRNIGKVAARLSATLRQLRRELMPT